MTDIDIDISDQKYRQYRYLLLLRSLAYSHVFIIASKVVSDITVIP